MGFFSDAWNSVKKVGHSIGSGMKKVGHAVYKGADTVSKIGHKVKNAVKKGYDVASKIPVVGEAVDKAVNTQFLPGVSISRIGDVASKGLDAVDAVGEGAELVEKLGGAIDGKNPKDAMKNAKDLRRFGKKFNTNHIQPIRNAFA